MKGLVKYTKCKWTIKEKKHKEEIMGEFTEVALWNF
jgi:hypothetical protein